MIFNIRTSFSFQTFQNRLHLQRSIVRLSSHPVNDFGNKQARVKVIYSPRFLEHKAPFFHSECPERLIEIEKRLRSLSKLGWSSPSGSGSVRRQLALDLVKSTHSESYVQELESISLSGGGSLDYDTYVHPQTYEVALLAVTAWLDAVDSVLNDQIPAFALARPPGHHATRTTGMGFCLFNNAVVAAKYALTFEQCNRVAIFDWDVHHGNGVANLVQDIPEIRYCSIHEDGSYPMTGAAHEKGKEGNLLNVPLPPYTTWNEYKQPFYENIVPFMEDFSPDLVIICAGYDALASDYLANFNLHPEDFKEMSLALQKKFGTKLMWGLEGGYDTSAIPHAVYETLSPFLESEERGNRKI